MVVRLLILLFGLISSGTAQKQENESLAGVLRQMETTGQQFKNFTAKFSQKKYTAILDEFDEPESGIFMYARANDGSALLRQEVINPAPRILTIKGGTATIYQPGLKQAQIVNLGNNKDKAEYLALGLGQSPGKLRESFDLEYKGTETIDEFPCSVLVLKPKSAAAAAFFSSITLWIKKSNGAPIQQKLQEPNRDYLLVNFSEERLNGRIRNSMFRQNLPRDTDIQAIG